MSMLYLKNLDASSVPDDILRRIEAWAELEEVGDVERVLTPISVTITAISNITLLLHEARVVWRTQRLIPPKLLVMVLSSADLLATLLGYLPLWILFVTASGSAPALEHVKHPTNRSHPGTELGEMTTTSTRQEPNRQNVMSSGLRGLHVEGYSEVTQGVAYSVCFFLLTSFWTLAQWVVVVMGTERLLALRAPYFYAARCTCHAFLAVVGALTALSCGIGGFYLAVHLAEVNDHFLVYAGFVDSQSLAHNISMLVQGLLCTLVLLVCNWAVTRELRRMERTVTVMRVKDHSEYMKQLSMVHGAGREFARFMMAVNVLFLLSSCPNLMCVILRLSHVSPQFSIQYFCWRMSHISTLLNPFLYGFLRKSLRSRIRHFLNQHFPCLRPVRVADDSGDPGPSVRYENDNSHQHHRDHTPDSTIMPRDPEASLINSSE